MYNEIYLALLKHDTVTALCEADFLPESVLLLKLETALGLVHLLTLRKKGSDLKQLLPGISM